MFKNPIKAKSAVLTVGDGRGFVIESQGERVVVTAAHCLPHFPPCHGASYIEERVYADFLGPLGEKPGVWAECFFADPIADIAVLGSPDNQSLFDEADAYEALVEPVTPLKIAEAPEKGRAWLLSLNGEWFECAVEYTKRLDGVLLVSDGAQPITGGMSGSPVVSDDGKAIGVVCLGGHGKDSVHNPRLTRDLPRRFLRSRRKKLSPDELRALGVPEAIITGFDSKEASPYQRQAEVDRADETISTATIND
jgi:hypothetical protein